MPEFSQGFNPLTESTDTRVPSFTISSIAELNKVRRTKHLAEIYVSFPEDIDYSFKKKVCHLPVHKITVKPNNTFDMSQLNHERIKEIQFLHSLAKDKEEYDHLFSTFWPQIKGSLSKAREFEELGLYVLAFREIFSITKMPAHNILNIRSFRQLQELYATENKYLYLSKTELWKNWIYQKSEKFIMPTVAIDKVFSNKILNDLLKVHSPNSASSHDKMVQWIKIRNNFFKVVEMMEVYEKNKDMFLSYGVDFNNFRINVPKELDQFEKQLEDIVPYKILTRLLQRLDSEKRQEIRNHRYLFNDYFNLCKKLYKTGASFEKFEPVLKKIHYYKDSSTMYVSLSNIIEPFNIYTIHEEANVHPDVEVEYYDENLQRIMMKIKSYEAMQTFGSKSWCIAVNEDRYRSYKQGWKQYYIYIDAKKLDYDGEPLMIGYTVTRWRKSVVHANNRRDQCVKLSIGNDIFRDFLNRRSSRRS